MSASSSIAQVNTLATQTVHSLWNFGSDFLIVIALFAAFFLFVWYIGRGPLVALLLALYAGYAVYSFFPYTSLLPTSPATTTLFSHLGLYAAITFIFFIILRRVVVSDFLYIGLFGIISLSFLGAAFLLALAYHVFPVASIYHFTPAVALLFAPKAYFFWWFVGPALGLFFFAR